VRLALAVALLLAPAALHGQNPQPEARVDALGTGPVRWHAGGGLTWALGYYARLGFVGSYSPPLQAREARSEWRADVVARMVLDPFRQQMIGVSVGGGLTVRHRAYLLALLEVEGPEMRGTLPALQLGLGGGLRVGLILRKAVPARR
jgi:hypothetical protein